MVMPPRPKIADGDNTARQKRPRLVVRQIGSRQGAQRGIRSNPADSDRADPHVSIRVEGRPSDQS